MYARAHNVAKKTAISFFFSHEISFSAVGGDVIGWMAVNGSEWMCGGEIKW
jgi:hypothetical protein